MEPELPTIEPKAIAVSRKPEPRPRFLEFRAQKSLSSTTPLVSQFTPPLSTCRFRLLFRGRLPLYKILHPSVHFMPNSRVIKLEHSEALSPSTLSSQCPTSIDHHLAAQRYQEETIMVSNFALSSLTPEQTQFFRQRTSSDLAPRDIAAEFNKRFQPLVIVQRQVVYFIIQLKAEMHRNPQYVATTVPQPSIVEPLSCRTFLAGQSTANHRLLHSQSNVLEQPQP
ncbi:hypothetical protein QBC36DRAFT_106843 [Triangularia setosa]|uniref:Uncharacterized protein n=1 Tax=Triangularia setosa TaxID=2587417 RepID=A0AAN6WGC2_9PEZI|nr:hypothetical protein QBC36DRAFT_106843 [Podospora setosa]